MFERYTQDLEKRIQEKGLSQAYLDEFTPLISEFAINIVSTEGPLTVAQIARALAPAIEPYLKKSNRGQRKSKEGYIEQLRPRIAALLRDLVSSSAGDSRLFGEQLGHAISAVHGDYNFYRGRGAKHFLTEIVVSPDKKGLIKKIGTHSEKRDRIVVEGVFSGERWDEEKLKKYVSLLKEEFEKAGIECGGVRFDGILPPVFEALSAILDSERGMPTMEAAENLAPAIGNYLIRPKHYSWLDGNVAMALSSALCRKCKLYPEANPQVKAIGLQDVLKLVYDEGRVYRNLGSRRINITTRFVYNDQEAFVRYIKERTKERKENYIEGRL